MLISYEEWRVTFFLKKKNMEDEEWIKQHVWNFHIKISTYISFNFFIYFYFNDLENACLFLLLLNIFANIDERFGLSFFYYFRNTVSGFEAVFVM